MRDQINLLFCTPSVTNCELCSKRLSLLSVRQYDKYPVTHSGDCQITHLWFGLLSSISVSQSPNSLGLLPPKLFHLVSDNPGNDRETNLTSCKAIGENTSLCRRGDSVLLTNQQVFFKDIYLTDVGQLKNRTLRKMETKISRSTVLILVGEILSYRCQRGLNGKERMTGIAEQK